MYGFDGSKIQKQLYVLNVVYELSPCTLLFLCLEIENGR